MRRFIRFMKDLISYIRIPFRDAWAEARIGLAVPGPGGLGSN